MKIAAAAYPIDWHNRWNDYVGKLRVWVRTAAEQGAELLVFPEHGGARARQPRRRGQRPRPPHRRSTRSAPAIKDVDELHGSLAREFKVHVLRRARARSAARTARRSTAPACSRPTAATATRTR